jgi:mannose-1-phosphate guanylyltransferase
MLVPVILSGGAGTRLWPASREAHPKPFIELADGYNLLQKTALRAARLPGVVNLLTVTNREYYFKSHDDLQALGAALPASRYLLEPFGRNTGAAALLAAFQVRECWGEQAVMLMLPADHLIEQQDVFAAAVADAAAVAAEGRLVTFGIRPTEPHTGYGYIELGDPLGERAHIANGFKEKPQLELAEQYLASGRYVWNSGMFCFSAATLLTTAERVAPDLYAAAAACWDASRNGGALPDALELARDALAACPDISIDYAIMEKADNVAVVPASFDWSDIGAWDAVGNLTGADEHGNRIEGEAITVASHNCYIRGQGRLIAAVGVDNLVVVDTPDALLVCHQDKVQQVKDVVAELKRRDHESYRLHRTVYRPWGSYTVLEEGPGYKIKRIEVKPGAALSLQMHHHRNEHWIVVSGSATVTNNEDTLLLTSNESTYIKAGHKHRLENQGVIPLVMIEVQSGEYLGEDDIVRFVDNYGRQ